MKILPAIVALALVAGGTARGAALVGETRQFALEPTPPPVFSELRAAYRRPDTIPFPLSDPYLPEKAALGRILFNDTRLSGNRTLACASCHSPGFDYGNGMGRRIGQDLKLMSRRSPSLVNSAWGSLFQWDGRAASLEEQVPIVFKSPGAMDLPLDGPSRVLSGIPEYHSLFAAAFAPHTITQQAIASALATYERTIISADAPFDAWIDGNQTALPEAAKRGFGLFNTKARCALCHSGWNFTDNGFHDIGLPAGGAPAGNVPEGIVPEGIVPDSDLGRGRLFPAIIKLQHAFKTPSLRDTDRRAPYMHNGSLPTLESVVAHYNQGGVDRPSRSELIGPLGLTAREQSDIVAFLETLTTPVSSGFVPALPR